MLSRTLNINSAAVNLHRRRDSNDESETGSNRSVAKTFNPPKQWLESFKLDENTSKRRKRAHKNQSHVVKRDNGTLTVGTHTFKGIWANTGGGNRNVDGNAANEERTGSAGNVEQQ